MRPRATPFAIMNKGSLQGTFRAYGVLNLSIMERTKECRYYDGNIHQVEATCYLSGRLDGSRVTKYVVAKSIEDACGYMRFMMRGTYAKVIITHIRVMTEDNVLVDANYPEPHE